MLGNNESDRYEHNIKEAQVLKLERIVLERVSRPVRIYTRLPIRWGSLAYIVLLISSVGVELMAVYQLIV